MKTPWTKGHWTSNGDGYIHSDESVVAQAFGPPFSCRSANAALIALAPEMAEAILKWYEDADDFEDLIEIGRRLSEIK